MSQIRCLFLVSIAMMAVPGLVAAGDFPLGVLMTPRWYPFQNDQDLQAALAQAKMVGDWGTAFWEWNAGDDGFRSVEGMTTLYRGVDMGVLAQLSPTSLGEIIPPGGVTGTSFADADVRQRYLADVQRIASLQPEYLNLAAEINLYTHIRPEEYEAFRTLYQEAYDLAKAVSPQTQVGVSYHFDLIYYEGNFDLPGRLGPQDFIGVSSYPSWTVYKGLFDSIHEIPPEYYSWLRRAYPDKPIVFTEIGWPHAGEGSLQDQADFILSLPRLLADLDPELVVWTLLHDVAHFNVEMLSPGQIAVLNGFEMDPETLFAELNSMGLLTWDD